MKLQTKIFLLLSIIFGVVVLSLVTYSYIHFHENEIYYAENRKNQELIINKVIQIKRAKYEQLINDNSGWDDMVKFAAHPDFEWAKNNVDFFVNSFHLSFVRVYNKNEEQVYQFGDSLILKNLILPEENRMIGNFSDTAFVHFYQYCDNRLTEILGATIVPAFDTDTRTTPPQGYIFVGRVWDNQYVNDFAQATGYTIQLLKESDSKSVEHDPNRIYFSRSICDINNLGIASLTFSKNDPLKEDLDSLFYLSVLVTILSVVLIFCFIYYFKKIVLQPISKINQTLDKHDSKYIEDLAYNKDEFKLLADLIVQFFNQQEELKINNQELREINATKDKLFSIIAHDLRNPIGNILVISDMIMNYSSHITEVHKNEKIKKISLQAKESMALLETLFEWAKSQTGQLVFNPQNLVLDKLFKDLMANYMNAAIMKEITVETITPDEIQVYADQNMLNTILRNLLSNAVKFTYDGGKILISAVETDGLIEITVADNGVGMDQKTLSGLFKIETSSSSVGTAKEKGTGLGLIICRDFIEKHGGRIWVTSELGKGSRFSFTLHSAS